MSFVVKLLLKMNTAAVVTQRDVQWEFHITKTNNYQLLTN